MADNLPAFMHRLSWNLGSLNFLEPSGPIHACNGILVIRTYSEGHSVNAFFIMRDLTHVACLIFAPTVLMLACQPKVLSQSNVWLICDVQSGTWTGFPLRIWFCLGNSSACTEIISQSNTSVESVACQLCVKQFEKLCNAENSVSKADSRNEAN
jgi:hypothetical protein